MRKINVRWIYYFIGCIIGGIILGLIFAKASDAPAGADLSAEAGYHPPVNSSESPSLSPLPSSSPDNLVTLLFTGDVMLGRSVNTRIQSSGNPSWPFINVASVLREADITYINLESPLISNCPKTDTGMKFCGDIGNIAGLVQSGVDVASIANNHATNYGATGLAETMSVLSSNNIKVIGGDRSATIVRGSHKYSFYSFNDVGEDAAKNISIFPKQEDELIIATFHWGNEYQSTPTKRQISLAHAAIDAGADLVIGAHPHWVQTHEIYKDKPIYYSLGNFVFDQEWSAETKRGLVVRFTFRASNLVQTKELPVLIENYGQPRWQ